MQVDPSNAPPFQILAWNLFLGERQVVLSTPPQCVTYLLSQVDMQDLAAVYFAKIDPFYGFIDRANMDRTIQRRWTTTEGVSLAEDAFLSGLAAVACVFTNLMDFQTETGLVAMAKACLDAIVTEEPSVHGANAWVLRTVYLRLTSRPEEAWTASCTALHMIDAKGLHSEPDLNNTLFQRAAEEVDSDIRRRLFGVARHLNTWLSFDLARSRVVLQNASQVLPAKRSGDYTTELLELLPYTQNLDPGKALSGAELLTNLSEVLSRIYSQPTSILAQCNLMLCFYRRLYTLRWKIPSQTNSRIINLIQMGLQAVHKNVENGSPWHNLASVPFQSVCTLLAIDTTESFSILANALVCLDTVDQTYQTKATKDATNTVRALMFMHRKRREADIRRQSEILKLYPATHTQEESFDAFLLSQAFTQLPWFNDLIPNMDVGNSDDSIGT